MALNFPANPSVGQVYNTGLKTWKWSGNSWTTLGVGEGTVIATSETPPLNPSIGDLWFNDNTAVLSVFYGDGNTDQWVTVSTSSNAEGGGANVVSQETAPADPSAGDLWFNTNTAVLYIYYADNTTLQWVTVTPSIASIGSGASVTTSETVPSTPSDGDLWFNTGDGNLYVYYVEVGGSSQWVSTVATAADASAVSYTPAGTGAQVTTVRAKLRERITPADFGAVGDGTTDDTAAIQAAIDHAESLCDTEFSDVGAGYVQVDLGGLLYRVTSTLTINRKIKFGNGNLIVTTDFPVGDGTDSCVIYVSSFATERLIIHDLDIDCGLDVSDSSKRSNGIYATQCQRCLFTNINMIHMREFGLYIVSVQGGRFENMILNEWTNADTNAVPTNNGIEDYTYRTSTCLSVDTNDCLFSNINCSHGLYPMKSDKGSANLWNNCHFVTAPTEGVGHVCVWLKTDTVAGTYAVGNMFTGCYFDNGEVLIENGFKNSFTGCKFVDSSVQQGLPSTSVDTAIRFKATEAGKTVEGVVVVGCIFENVSPQFTKTAEGVGSWTGVDSIAVTGSLRDGGELPDNYQITEGLYWDGDKLVVSPNTNDYAIEIANRLTTYSAHDDRSTGFTASRWGTGTDPVMFVGAKSRGTTIGTFGDDYLVEGDSVARFGGVADRGNDFGNNAASNSGGYIQFEADGDHASFDTPFRMVTYLTPDGSAANASEVARVRNNGQQEITLVMDTEVNLLDATADINTTRKRQGLMVFDTTNNRIMVAAGASATDVWYIADGSSSVTPV